MNPQDQGPLPSAFGCHLPRARGRLFVCGALSVLRAGWGALPSPGGEGAELARRKGSLGWAEKCGFMYVEGGPANDAD